VNLKETSQRLIITIKMAQAALYSLVDDYHWLLVWSLKVFKQQL